jgi:hypothetical protein
MTRLYYAIRTALAAITWPYALYTGQIQLWKTAIRHYWYIARTGDVIGAPTE